LTKGGTLYKIQNMTTVTIPKELKNEKDLIAIPRREYEALLELKKIREFIPTAAQKRALAQARKNRKTGNYLTIDELRKKLGFAR